MFEADSTFSLVSPSPSSTLYSPLWNPERTSLHLQLLNHLPNSLGSLPSPSSAEFTKAFKVFDKEDSGFIAVGEIKYILTQLGERMEDGEVEELLKMANVTA